MNPAEHDKAEPARQALNGIVFGSPSGFLAFGFGAGLSPFAPGTMGTLVAIPFVFVLKSLDPAVFWIVLLLLFLLGCQAVRAGQPQPGCSRSRWYRLG